MESATPSPNIRAQYVNSLEKQLQIKDQQITDLLKSNKELQAQVRLVMEHTFYRPVGVARPDIHPSDTTEIETQVLSDVSEIPSASDGAEIAERDQRAAEIDEELKKELPAIEGEHAPHHAAIQSRVAAADSVAS